ncbi:uncharacterized protein LOC136025876 isoform X2 [Artemia franciscana]|nr:hypothetical protein QYM36_012132 [Artemia franciscana]
MQFYLLAFVVIGLVRGQGRVAFEDDTEENASVDAASVSVENPDLDERFNRRPAIVNSKFLPGLAGGLFGGQGPFGGQGLLGGQGLNTINSGFGACQACNLNPQFAPQCCQSGFSQCCFGGFGGGLQQGGFQQGGFQQGGFGGFGLGIKPGACPSFFDSLLNLRRKRQTVAFEEEEPATTTTATSDEGDDMTRSGGRSIGKDNKPSTRIIGSLFGQKCNSDFECPGSQKCCSSGLIGLTSICKNAIVA